MIKLYKTLREPIPKVNISGDVRWKVESSIKLHDDLDMLEHIAHIMRVTWITWIRKNVKVN